MWILAVLAASLRVESTGWWRQGIPRRIMSRWRPSTHLREVTMERRMVGAALSGVTYTALSGTFDDLGHPEYIWFALGANTLLAIGVLTLFTKRAGELQEQEA